MCIVVITSSRTTSAIITAARLMIEIGGSIECGHVTLDVKGHQ